MKLDELQKKILIEKLKFLKSVNCVCGSKNWIANTTIFEMREFHEGNLVIGGQTSVIPIMTVQCDKCGHTILFNALTLGVIQNKNGTKK